MKPFLKRAAPVLFAFVAVALAIGVFLHAHGSSGSGEAGRPAFPGLPRRSAGAHSWRKASDPGRRDAAAVSLSVRVIDADGNPVDASVLVFSESELDAWNRSHGLAPHGNVFSCGCQESLRAVAAMAAEGFSPPAPAISGASLASDGGLLRLEGSARLPVAILALADDGSKAGFLKGWGAAPLSGAAGVEGDEAVVGVHKAVSLHGVVLDSRGRPETGATVAAYSTQMPLCATSTAGEDGRFQVHPVPTGGVRVAVLADGYAPQTVSEVVGTGRGQEAPLVIRLRESGRILGRTLDAKGRAVAGASVQLHSARRTEGEDSLLDVAESGDDGTFALASPGRGRYVVSAFKGRMWAMADVPDDAVAAHEGEGGSGGGSRSVDLVLRNGVSVTGRVYDASSGEGVPGADVHVSTDDRTICQARSGHGGEFSLEGVPSFAWISLGAPGYVGQRRILPDAGDAGAVRQDFALERSLAVSGRIIPPPGDTGLPPGLVVSMDQGGKRQTVQVDGEGGFAFEATGNGVAELETHHSSAGRAHALVNPPATGLEIPLVRGASIAARILDGETSEPLPAGTLIAARGSPSDRDGLSNTFLTDVPPSGDGTLVLSGLFPGVYDAVIRSPGHLEQRVRDVRLVGEDEFADLGVVRLSRGRTVAGVVLDASGSPVPDADVKVVAKGGEGASYGLDLFTATTGPDGRFSVSGMADPAIAFAFHDALGESDEVRIPDSKEGALHVELVLKGADDGGERATVEGRVVGDMGDSVPSFSINGQMYSSSPDGSFTVFAPCDGSGDDAFFLDVEAPGYAPEERTVGLVCGGTVQAGTIRLGRGKSLSGTVLSHEGAPVGSAVVTVEAACSELSLFEISSVSNADGAFVVRGIPKGCDGVLAQAKAASRSSGKVRVLFPDGVASRDGVRLELSALGSVHGQVRDASGNPVPGASVSFSGAGALGGVGSEDFDQEIHSVSDSHGDYSIHGCPVGPAVVSCEYQLPDGQAYMDNRAVSISREGERVRVDFEAPSDAGSLVVGTRIPGARFSVLVPGTMIRELAAEAGEVDGSKGVMIQSAQFYGGSARFDGVPSGVYLVIVRADPAGDALGTAVARVPPGGFGSVMVEPDGAAEVAAEVAADGG